MEYFINAMGLIIHLFQKEFTLYGFTFSLWHVILMSILGIIVGKFLAVLFDL